MDPTLTIACYGVGAAAVAFWVVVRFPGFGPRGVGSALLLTVAAFVVQAPLLALTDRVVANFSVAGALVIVILPSLMLLFWAGGCLVRSLVSLEAPYRR